MQFILETTKLSKIFKLFSMAFTTTLIINLLHKRQLRNIERRHTKQSENLINHQAVYVKTQSTSLQVFVWPYKM